MVFDPDTGAAIAFVIVAVSACAGALATGLMVWVVRTGHRRRERALRRGIEVTAIVGLLLLLRVVDGLTVITGGFIVAGFLVAEAILSARPSRASR
jgi:hypothetical protein